MSDARERAAFPLLPWERFLLTYVLSWASSKIKGFNVRFRLMSTSASGRELHFVDNIRSSGIEPVAAFVAYSGTRLHHVQQRLQSAQ
jgi:hypothetical protein